MKRRRAGDAVEGALDRLQSELARLLRPRLHIGLVDLHDVRPGGEEVLDLKVHRCRVVERHVLVAFVEIVLRLLRHREGAGHGDLHHALGVGLQKFQVAHLDRMLPADFSGDARHGIGMAAPVERRARIVEIDAFERRGETVRIALPPHLAVGDDVEPGAFLVADRKDRRVILRLVEELRRDPPQFLRPHTRRKAAGELFPVDKPLGLRIGADERRRKEL